MSTSIKNFGFLMTTCLDRNTKPLGHLLEHFRYLLHVLMAIDGQSGKGQWLAKALSACQIFYIMVNK